jgi:hypothetical protein
VIFHLTLFGEPACKAPYLKEHSESRRKKILTKRRTYPISVKERKAGNCSTGVKLVAGFGFVKSRGLRVEALSTFDVMFLNLIGINWMRHAMKGVTDLCGRPISKSRAVNAKTRAIPNAKNHQQAKSESSNPNVANFGRSRFVL